MKKQCTKCREEKSIGEFYQHPAFKEGLQSQCKACMRKYAQEYQTANRDKTREQRLKYNAANRDKISGYNRQKYKTDPLFRLVSCLRTSLRIALHNQSVQKECGVLKLLGCTILELRARFEQLFQPGMTWENHGLHGWHVDHITPLCTFDYGDPIQLAEAFHYTNLQPLWAKENLSKGARAHAKGIKS